MIHHLGLIKIAFPHIRTNNENTQFEHILFIIYSQAIVHYVIVRLNHRFITFRSMVDQWRINQLVQYHLHFNTSFKYSCFSGIKFIWIFSTLQDLFIQKHTYVHWRIQWAPWTLAPRCPNSFIFMRFSAKILVPQENHGSTTDVLLYYICKRKCAHYHCKS